MSDRYIIIARLGSGAYHLRHSPNPDLRDKYFYTASEHQADSTEEREALKTALQERYGKMDFAVDKLVVSDADWS